MQIATDSLNRVIIAGESTTAPGVSGVVARLGETSGNQIFDAGTWDINLWLPGEDSPMPRYLGSTQPPYCN